jgi:hypothetical protein
MHDCLLRDSASGAGYAYLSLFDQYHDVPYLFSVIDPDVVTVLRAVPEFTDRYLVLVEAADGDPGAPAAFAELAEFVAALASKLRRLQPLLDRCLWAVETVAATSHEAQAHVGWAFLDSLSPDEAAALRSMFGPATNALLRGLEEDLGRRPSTR